MTLMEGGLSAAVQNQKIFAVGRQNGSHGKRINIYLRANGMNHPAAVQEKTSVRQFPHMFNFGLLRNQQQGREDERQGDEEFRKDAIESPIIPGVSERGMTSPSRR